MMHLDAFSTTQSISIIEFPIETTETLVWFESLTLMCQKQQAKSLEAHRFSVEKANTFLDAAEATSVHYM